VTTVVSTTFSSRSELQFPFEFAAESMPKNENPPTISFLAAGDKTPALNSAN
jgi:hypothetical protein